MCGVALVTACTSTDQDRTVDRPEVQAVGPRPVKIGSEVWQQSDGLTATGPSVRPLGPGRCWSAKAYAFRQPTGHVARSG
jgi:hypothetical protein